MLIAIKMVDGDTSVVNSTNKNKKLSQLMDLFNPLIGRGGKCFIVLLSDQQKHERILEALRVASKENGWRLVEEKTPIAN